MVGNGRLWVGKVEGLMLGRIKGNKWGWEKGEGLGGELGGIKDGKHWMG